MSFYTSLSGLQASQTEMSTISHNLANVSTNGFKKSRTEFADVMASSVSMSPTQMIGSGTVVKAIRQQFGQGGSIQSTNALDMMISGEGFFAVKPDPNSAKVAFTRNGGFSVDANRFVTDSNGGHLQVYPVDGSGTVVATGLDSTINLRLPATSGTPAASQAVTLAVNLSANASIPNGVPSPTSAVKLGVNLPNTATLPKDHASFNPTTNPYKFDRANPASYNSTSTTAVYDQAGKAVTVTNYYVRDTAAAGAGTTSDWLVYSFAGNEELALDGQPAGPVKLSFDPAGTMVAPTTPSVFGGFTPAGQTTRQPISIDFTAGTVQSSQAFGKISETQNGRPAGGTIFNAANPYKFDRFNPATYNNSSQTTVYDAVGNAMTMTNYYVRDTASSGAGTSSDWLVYSFVGDKALEVGTKTDPVKLTFDSNGSLTSPTNPIAFDAFTPAGSTAAQQMTLDFGSQTTQLGQPFAKKAETQDGRAVGQLEGVSVGEDGIVRASFSNGDNQALGKIVLANFSNPSGLRQLGSSYWASTGVSGEARLGEAGANGFGNLMSGAVERSNVDITEELVGLIAAQRNFQANAKSLETSSQISQTIFNMRT